MSFKTILVQSDRDPEADRRLRLAVQVADIFGAALIGLGAEAYDSWLDTEYMVPDGAIVDSLRKCVDDDLAEAERRFFAVAETRAETSWISAHALAADALAFHARSADLIVADRQRRKPNLVVSPADIALRSGTPMLIAADGVAPLRGEQVVVAWKDTRECRRALADAMPFLRRAKTVTIVSIAPEDRLGLSDSLGEVVRRLERHGIGATVEIKPRRKEPVSQTLQDAAARLSADLIVCGAYGHSRIREWTLGGVTEDILSASSVHLLVSH